MSHRHNRANTAVRRYRRERISSVRKRCTTVAPVLSVRKMSGANAWTPNLGVESGWI